MCATLTKSHPYARQDIMVGDECAAHRHNLEVQYPVTNGASTGRGSALLLVG